MKSWSMTSRSVAQTRLAGQLLGQAVAAGTVVLLNGNLGAGKTCFAQGVGLGVGLSPELPVTSPSYALMHVYQGRMPFFHFDLYRLSRVEDLEDLGYDDYAGAAGLTLVEWADRISDAPEAALVVTLERDPGDVDWRRLHFEARDSGGAQLLDAIVRAWSELPADEAKTA